MLMARLPILLGLYVCATAWAREVTVRPANRPLAHVFATGAPVKLRFETAALSLEYEITDFWLRCVASGTLEVKNGRAELEVGNAKNGYFLVRLHPLGGKPEEDGFTSFAVIPAYTVRVPATAPWGAMTHFAQGMNPEFLPVLKQAGIVAIRDEHYWNQVEKERGVYTFSPQSDAYMVACKSLGLDPLVEMTFANKLYDGGQTPYTSEGCDAFGNYGAAMLKHYGSQVKWVEVWNEYNGTWCKGPAEKDRSYYYAQMIKHAWAKLKAERPDVKVLGCGTVLIPLPFIESVFKQGGLKHMDAVAIHPYRGAPEGVDQEVEELRALIKRYNDGQDKPIWVTETGSINKTEYDWEQGRHTYEQGRAKAARYLARQYVLLLKGGVEKIFWYLASDHMEFVSMGLLRKRDEESGMGAYAVASPYVAYATMIRQLDGTTFVEREARRDYSRAYCLRFEGGGRTVRCCWATRPSRLVFATAAPLTVTDLMGGVTTLEPQDGQVALEAGLDMQYVIGPITSVAEAETGAQLLAVSSDDYSKEQGRNHWFYGYRVGLKGNFQEMKQVETMWGYEWGGVEGHKYLKQSDGGGHPSMSAQTQVYVDRRWVSPVEGEVDLQAEISIGNAKSDGVDTHLLVDGQDVAHAHVISTKGKHTTLSVRVRLKLGTTIDLLIGPHKNTQFDGAAFELTVSRKTK